MASFFQFTTDGGKALSLSLPANPPLVLAASNPLDRNQQFTLAPSGAEGQFVVSRPKGQVFDVTGSKIVEGTPVTVYTKKAATAENFNQRFLFTSPGNITIVGASKLNVVAVSDAKVVLSSKTQTFTTASIPADHAITIENSTSGPLTVTYDNAPASEATKSWVVEPSSSHPFNLPEGATFSVKDADGKVLPPTPQTVSKAATFTFKDVTQAKLIYFALPGQQGESVEYTADEPNLANRPGWNDRPQSFRVVAGSWIIYQDWYTGNKIVANPRGGKNLDGNYDYPIWGGYPSTVVGITSHRLLPTSGLALFDTIEFQSTATGLLLLNDDVADLTTLKFENKINSLVVVSGIWELWDRPGFQGAKRIVSLNGGRDGTGWFNIYQQWGGRANSTMSIRKYVPPAPVQQ